MRFELFGFFRSLNIDRDRYLLMLLFLSSVYAGVSCSSSSQQLEIRGKYRDVVLVDTKGRSCVSFYSTPTDPPDLSPIKAIMGGVKLNLKGQVPLEIIYLRLRFDLGNDNQAVTVISGEELSALFTTNPSSGAVVLPANTSVDTSQLANACNWEVGGISLANKDQSVFGSATLSVYALTQENPPKVIQASDNFAFQFIGLNN